MKKTEEDWRRELSPAQYHVLRECGTERAFTGAYWNEKRPGVYRCAGCKTVLFDSSTKYDSGSGWPSFWEAVDESLVKRLEDRSHGMSAWRCAAPRATDTSATSSPTARRRPASGIA